MSISKPLRQSWDAYFMSLADQVSTRGTCDRKRVGAILVRDKHIISTGYNGSLPGLPHCDDVGHDMDEGNHCVRTTHAEINAIAAAARMGVSTDGATCYCNVLPCWACMKAIVSAGVKEVVYKDAYRPETQHRVFRVAEQLAGFVFRQFTEDQ